MYPHCTPPTVNKTTNTKDYTGGEGAGGIRHVEKTQVLQTDG